MLPTQTFLVASVSLLVTASASWAIPQWARQYRVDCSHCHIAPPKLNTRGEAFLAAGYRFPEVSAPLARAGLPLTVWTTFDVEHRQSADLVKGYPSRIEPISAGTAGAASYFIEWRALSQQIGAGNRLLNRTGRFEDLFLSVPVARRALSITVGQFRGLAQVDVSRRLMISEPLVFSSSVPGRRASSARLTALRAFSPASRQPAVRLAWQTGGDENYERSWYSAATLPLTGELTIPATDAASFELEGKLKGAFFETYYRRGLNSVGAHTFLAKSRQMAGVIATRQMGPRVSLLAAVGVFRSGVADMRLSTGGEYVFNQHMISGVRVDHQTARGRDPSVHLYFNGHAPFGPAAWRQALRVQLEQRLQPRNHALTLGLSHIF